MLGIHVLSIMGEWVTAQQVRLGGTGEWSVHGAESPLLRVN